MLTLADPPIYGPVFQGEGHLIGTKTLFVRLAGCDYRCHWCDTLYAVDPKRFRKEWTKLSTKTVIERCEALQRAPCWITLSGGNPALQDCGTLILGLQERGYSVAMETQGSIAKDWFRLLTHLTLSPKPPSAGKATPVEEVRQCLAVAPANVTLKIVVFDEVDLDYAVNLIAALEWEDPVLQAGTGYKLPITDRLQWLEARVVARGISARVLPQLHSLIHGASRRDV